MFRGHLDYSQKPPIGGKPNTKPGDHGTPKSHDCWFVILYHVWGPRKHKFIKIAFGFRPGQHMTSHYTCGPVTTLHEFGGVLGRPLESSFGLSQLHNHGSWLMCEEALMVNNFIIIVTSLHLAFKCTHWYLGTSTFKHVMEVYAYVTQWSTSWLKCIQITLGFSMLKSIFLLHTKMWTHDTCH